MYSSSMKLLLLLYFACTLPIVVLLTTVLYGGVSTTVLKKELARARIYNTFSTYISEFTIEDADDETSEQITQIIKNRFTPTYVQTKAERALDDTHAWMLGKTISSPVISFKEVKEDILAKNPELLTSLESMAEEINSESNNDEMSSLKKASEGFSSIAKSDFSINLGDKLTGLKSGYAALRIIHPVLVVLMLGSLILQSLLSSSALSRLKWLGATLMVAGIIGFASIISNTLLTKTIANIISSNTDQYIAMFSPIGLAIIQYFVSTYMQYQGFISIALLVAAAISFIGSEFIYKLHPTPSAKSKVKKK
jgi:hypothetical protein